MERLPTTALGQILLEGSVHGGCDGWGIYCTWGDEKSTQRFIEKSKGKKPSIRPSHKLEDDIKMAFEDVGISYPVICMYRNAYWYSCNVCIDCIISTKIGTCLTDFMGIH
jgi:hypothetical protein